MNVRNKLVAILVAFAIVFAATPGIAFAEKPRPEVVMPAPGPCQHKINDLSYVRKNRMYVFISQNWCQDSKTVEYLGDYVSHELEFCTTTVWLPCYNWKRVTFEQARGTRHTDKLGHDVYRQTSIWHQAKDQHVRWRATSVAHAIIRPYATGIPLRVKSAPIKRTITKNS